MDSSHTSTASRALALWEELTGRAVNSRDYTFRVNGEKFDLYHANKRVQEALAIADDVTVTLIIKTLSGMFAEYETFSLADILSGNERLQQRIDLVRRLHALFSDPGILERHEEFYRYCEGALAHYRNNEVTDSVREFVQSSAGFVGLDAFHGVEKLTRLMITDGMLGDAGDAKVSQFVFAFDSIEELISHARMIPTGFSLCAILSTHPSDSYFVMVARNGERTLLLTDKGNYTHPMQESSMRSRNDRYNMDRISRSHFPYDLLNIIWSDNGRKANVSGGSRELVVAESGLRVLGSLSELNNWNLLWLHLFIDQCRHRYFDQQQTEPRLAIGSMIRLPHKWLPERNASLPVPVEFELPLERRTSAELTTDFLRTIEPAWRDRPAPNRWMEERFAALVPDDCLYIPTNAMNTEVPLLTFDASNRPELTRADLSDMQEWQRRKLPVVNLVPLAQTALSTPERVVRDAHFLARHNQTQIIKQLVQRDYEARKDQMQSWWYKAAAKNLPNIIDDLLALNHKRFQIDTPELEVDFKSLGVGSIGNRRREIRIGYTPTRKQNMPRRDGRPSLAKVLKLEDYTYLTTHCAIDRSEEAQLFISLSTRLVSDLMLITGLGLNKIPVELHSRGTDSKFGNSILDRIDPIVELSNPWNDLPLYFVVPVSLKAFKAYRRRQGLPTPPATQLEAYARKTAEETIPPRTVPFPIPGIDA